MRNLLTGLIQLEKSSDKTVPLEDIQMGLIHGVRVGKLVSVEETGHVLVDYPDSSFGPVPARSILEISNEDLSGKVLLIFEKSDPRLPIIIGFVQEQPVLPALSEQVTLDSDGLKEIIIDGEKIVFDAQKEIVLRCGEGSVTIASDGKIVIKGTNLLSRSKGVNKIKGATVRIN
jgi:hypothetical protein